MASDVLVGIDLGTTVLKAAAIDARSGATLGMAARRLPIRTGPDGMREQDLTDVDRALRRVSAALRKQLGPAWRRVAGLGLASQGGSAILADRRTGRAHTPMQLWSDMRPVGLLADIAARKPPGYWRRLSCLDAPGAGLARIVWLRQRRPELFREENIYVGGGEYVYFQLTGVWRQDAGSALQIGCYDARRRRLTAGPLKLVGADANFVAPMREGHSTCPLSPAGAKRLGLSPGLPVTGPYLDHEGGYLSAAGGSSRPLQCSLGTAWVGNYVQRAGSPPPGVNLVLPSPVCDGSLMVRVMAGGNAGWDWGLATLLGRMDFARAEAVFRERLLPPAGLVALPWLTRPNPLEPGLHGSGGFLGADTHTTREDLLRALVAGMCHELAAVFRPVKDSGAVDRVVLGGGAAGGWQFRRILAGLFAPLPVYHSTDPAAGARGVLHAFGAKAARATMRRVPAPGRADVERILDDFDRYRRACAALAAGLDPPGALHGYPRRKPR